MSSLVQKNDLVSLEQSTHLLEERLLVVEAKVPESLECRTLLQAKNEIYMACLASGNAQCQALRNNETYAQGNLTLLTVESLDDSLASTLGSCENRTSLLRYLIGVVNPNPPQTLEEGSVMVTVEGSPPFSAGYALQRIVIGGLSLDYLVLLPWDAFASTMSVNPTITYGGGFSFLASSTGKRFLLNPQRANHFQGSIQVEAFGGNLVLYGRGTGNVKLTRRLVIAL